MTQSKWKQILRRQASFVLLSLLCISHQKPVIHLTECLSDSSLISPFFFLARDLLSGSYWIAGRDLSRSRKFTFSVMKSDLVTCYNYIEVACTEPQYWSVFRSSRAACCPFLKQTCRKCHANLFSCKQQNIPCPVLHKREIIQVSKKKKR